MPPQKLREQRAAGGSAEPQGRAGRARPRSGRAPWEVWAGPRRKSFPALRAVGLGEGRAGCRGHPATTWQAGPTVTRLRRVRQRSIRWQLSKGYPPRAHSEHDGKVLEAERAASVGAQATQAGSSEQGKGSCTSARFWKVLHAELRFWHFILGPRKPCQGFRWVVCTFPSSLGRLHGGSLGRGVGASLAVSGRSPDQKRGDLAIHKHAEVGEPSPYSPFSPPAGHHEG